MDVQQSFLIFSNPNSHEDLYLSIAEPCLSFFCQLNCNLLIYYQENRMALDIEEYVLHLQKRLKTLLALPLNINLNINKQISCKKSA
jgi:hypothetical protein